MLLPHLARIALALVSIPLAAPAASQTNVIDFEVGGPCSVAQASAAGLEYSAQGLTFVGPAPGAGAVILDACAGLAIPPRNGSAYLVVAPGQTSQTGPADGPVTIDFNPPVARFSTWAQAEQGSGTYRARAFQGGQLIMTSEVGAFGWSLLRVGNGDGIDRVVIETMNVPGAWMLDDMRVVRCPAGSVGYRFCAPPLQWAYGSRSCVSAYGTVTGGGPYTSLDFRVDGGVPGQFGMIIVSRARGIVVLPGANPFNGALCIAGDGQIARFPSLYAFDAAGIGTTSVDLTNVPFEMPLAVLPGDTLYFQGWHRDVYVPGWISPASFTDALEIRFE